MVEVRDAYCDFPLLEEDIIDEEAVAQNGSIPISTPAETTASTTVTATLVANTLSVNDSSGVQLQPNELTMRFIRPSLSDPLPPVLQGYSLIRNAEGGYYLVSTNDAAYSGYIDQITTSVLKSSVNPATISERQRQEYRLSNSSAMRLNIDAEEEIQWIVNAISAQPDRLATRVEICGWIGKHVMPLPPEWKTIVSRLLSARKDLFQRVVKHSEENTHAVYYTLDHVIGRHQASTSSSTNQQPSQSASYGRYRRILPKSDNQTTTSTRGDYPTAELLLIDSSTVMNIGSSSDERRRMSLRLKKARPREFNGPADATEIEMATGLDISVFNYLLKDMEMTAKSILDYTRPTIPARDALTLMLLCMLHDPTREQVDVWFTGNDDFGSNMKRRQMVHKWQQLQQIHQRWIPFLASWMEEFIVWSDPITEHLPSPLRNWLSTIERIPNLDDVIGVLDPMIIQVKRNHLDECCGCVAIFLIVYNFDGAIVYQSPVFWIACPITTPRLFENGLLAAVSSCYQRHLHRLLEHDQVLLMYSRNINDHGNLPSSIRVVRSQMIADLLHEKFSDRLGRFRILLEPISADTNSVRLMCLRDIVTICAGVANLSPPIAWTDEVTTDRDHQDFR